MARFVAFLRAVNVGRRRMEMAALREALEGDGISDVTTYIASGNAIVTSSLRPGDLEQEIERRIEAEFGFLAEAFVRTTAQVSTIVGRSPFGEVPAGHTHLVAFLRSAPSAAERRAIEALSGPVDSLEVHGAEVHWHIAGRSMDTELKPRDWKAVGAGLNTTRNITMLTKLAAKLQD